MALVAPTYWYAPLIIVGDMFFVFGTCKLLATMIGDIENELQALNGQKEIEKSIRKVIGMHSTIKQLSGNGHFNFKLFTIRITFVVSDLPQTSVIHSNFTVRSIFCGQS